MSNGSPRSLRAYATLVRLPNLFTAPPDIILGAALVASVSDTFPIWAVIGLSVASILLYAAGTTLNDCFDVTEDAHYRPERPLPSGVIERDRAFVVGISFLLGGIITASIVSGSVAGIIAGVLAFVILIYDGIFNGTITGFLFMGSSRALNVLLGMAIVEVVAKIPVRLLTIPLLILIYIASVTYMAEQETGESDRTSVFIAIGGTVLATVGAIGFLIVHPTSLLNTALVMVLLLVFIIWTGQPLWSAYAHPSPKTIGPAVGRCVLGLTILDAAFAATVSSKWALITLLFLIPSIGFSQMISVT
ncbi:UbiA family prenyltransferase [Haladaptatus sp. DYF46]|uniref:UbiA family prenyltransferase n=1 Tax=Haladaptatus sp. DYF46 TaxID=2886041 RepID=UPI0021020366|nr:UbiA family prenyltransferase [Haladaptatus sp. DYF46]